MYRNFRQISTGRWLNIAMAADQPQYPVSTAVSRSEVASEWGIDPADIEVVDGLVDARTGILIQGPAPTPDPNLADIRAAEPIWSTLTTAQKVEVVKSALRVIIKDKIGIP